MNHIPAYRVPKCIQEFRESCMIETLEIPVKARRRTIPTSHSDLVKSVQRNWKKYRKTQFKEQVCHT